MTYLLTSLHVGSLAALDAAVHYMYMREYWMQAISSNMIASTVFLRLQDQTVVKLRKPSLHVGSLAALDAAVRYMHTCEYWMQVQGIKFKRQKASTPS